MSKIELVFCNRITPVFLLLFLITACAPLIGPYSPTAYNYATSLKVETLAIMDKANEPYLNHQSSVEALVIELHKAHEYVKGVPSNSISAKQWEILIKEDGDLFGKFIKRWKDNSTLSMTFINEFKGLIIDAFDEIICLEANKKKPSKCKLYGGE
ncbi:MAG: hypothetical protein JW866_01375 [Ignavibacteriales bacterium]|nr:hypothetical protein [Ignavibacteriales bacterium]